MNIVICMDSWKGSLDALEACEAVARGILQIFPQARTQLFPLADGGEGTLERMASAGLGELRYADVTGPFVDRRVESPWLFQSGEGSALIEMAVCAGLPLLRQEERDPSRTTTRGVGELMNGAIQAGARSITLAVGGSATVDGGTGMASALGWRFLNAQGAPLPDGGGALRQLSRIQPPEKVGYPPVRVMCDVTNPLLGPKGAARIFGPQKGASPDEVEQLEEGLSLLADCLLRDVGVEVRGLSGGGAAGGIAAGAVAFLGAELVPGAREVIRLTGMEAALRGADAVITGEGRLDSQSLDGKVVSAVLEFAHESRVPVSVVAGSCELTETDCAEHGIQTALSANHLHLPLDQAMVRAAELAEEAGARLAREWANSERSFGTGAIGNV